MLLCDVLAKLLAFPINTITALLGIPIVIWVVIRNKSIVGHLIKSLFIDLAVFF